MKKCDIFIFFEKSRGQRRARESLTGWKVDLEEQGKSDNVLYGEDPQEGGYDDDAGSENNLGDNRLLKGIY